MFRKRLTSKIGRSVQAGRGSVEAEKRDPEPNACATDEDANSEGSATSALEQELSDLYQATASHLFRYGLLLTRNETLAQDAVQETFLRYYTQRKRGEVHAERAWLFRVLRNYVFDVQKSAGISMSVSLDDVRAFQDRACSPEKTFERSEAMRLALQALSPREMQCLQLRTEGFSYREIAAILDINPGTVGALLARGSDKIRKAFGKEKLSCDPLSETC